MFDEILFPEEISYGSTGGPKFKTSVFTAASGFEQRNVDWSRARYEFNAQCGIRHVDDMEFVRRFFMARNGKAVGFRFKDWADYRLIEELIGTGDGAETDYQIIKTYTSDQGASGESYSFVRAINKPAWDTLEVSVGGVILSETTDYEVAYSSGLIVFSTPPADGDEITVSGEFHVPVRFDTDQLNIEHDGYNAQSWPSVPLIEDFNWEEILF